MNSALQKFGIWLADVRLKSGYGSQRQLCLVSDVSPSTLSRIEAGYQKPGPDIREQKALHKRKLLTYIWLALLIANSAWLVVVLIRRHKNKPYDPILETYKKIFPE